MRTALVLAAFALASLGNLAAYAPIHEATHCLDHWLHGATSCTIVLYRPGSAQDGKQGLAYDSPQGQWGHAFVYPFSLSFTVLIQAILAHWAIVATKPKETST